MYKFSHNSMIHLSKAHPHLAMVSSLALYHSSENKGIDFGIIDSVRTIEKQREYLENGTSQTLNSRHLLRPGDVGSHAIDVGYFFDHELSDDWDHYRAIWKSYQWAMSITGIPLEWGGDWGWDAYHIQLPWEIYP